jgi:hypothetical protein
MFQFAVPLQYLGIIKAGVSNFIPEKSKRQSYMETLICIKYVLK